MRIWRYVDEDGDMKIKNGYEDMRDEDTNEEEWRLIYEQGDIKMKI